jgi:hypothetical protein
MPFPRSGHCVFCDDLRLEMGNKISLMGVYSGDLIFAASPPVTLPKLVIVAWFITDINDLPEKVTFSARLLAGTERALFDQELPVSPEHIMNRDGAFKVTLQFIGGVGPTVIEAPGFIEVFAETEREKNRIGRVRIVFAEPPPTSSSDSEGQASAGN